MNVSDSNADPAFNKYHVQIGEGKYFVIGDQAHVEYYLSPEGEPHVDLTAAEAIYRQRVVDTYNWLDFSPDSSLTHVALQDAFMHPALIVEKVTRVLVPVEQTSQAERGEPRQREQEITIREPIGLDKALNNHLLIVADPGAGKSTLLRWLAVTFASKRQQESDRLGPLADPDRLPVLVELGRLPNRYLQPEGGETPNWLEYLPHEHLSRQMAFINTPPQLLTRALVEGRCLLLFDGLDEVANHEARGRLANSLGELARLFPGNRVVVGSRQAGVGVSEHKLRRLFQRCEIQRFTFEDVQRFSHFWYAVDQSLTPEQQSSKADALIASIQAAPARLQMATSPLLCAMLVQIWRKEGALPKHRVKLYEECCRNLIEQWETAHHVEYQGILANMRWEDHLALLAPLAYVIHSREKRTAATRRELIPTLAHALQTKKGYAKWNAEEAADQFLDALSLRSGLLQYKGNDTYGFPHLTFQEYLTARYIAEQPDPDYIDLVMAHLHKEWWQEVHLLTIGYLGSGSPEMASKASNLILTILGAYKSPSWLLRPSEYLLVRLRKPERLFSFLQFDRRIAWLLAREFEMAAKGYAECQPERMTPRVNSAIANQAWSLVQHIIKDRSRFVQQKNLIPVASGLLQARRNKTLEDLLLQELRIQDPWLQPVAAESLGKVGISSETAVQALLHTAQYGGWESSRLKAAESLIQLGASNEAAVQALLHMLQHSRFDCRRTAMEGLRNVGVGNEAVTQALLHMLSDPDGSVRCTAVEGLGNVGTGNEAVTQALLHMLSDPDDGVRVTAAESLIQLGVGDETVVQALLQVLDNHPNGFLRFKAAKSLMQLGVGDETVVQALLDALRSGYGYYERLAAESLGKVEVGNEVVAQALLHQVLLEDLVVWNMYKDVQLAAAESLGRVGVGKVAIVQALLDVVLDRPDDLVGYTAAESLGRLGTGNEAVVQALLQALDHTRSQVRQVAVEILGNVGADNEAVVQALLHMLHDPDGFVRRAAAVSLGKAEVRKEAITQALLQILHDHLEGSIRLKVAESLLQMGTDNKAVVLALLQLLRDRDYNVQAAAAEDLSRLGIKDEDLLRQALVALMRLSDLEAVRQLLDGQQIPGYRWVPLRQRRARRQRLKRTSFWLGMTVVLVMIGLAVTWLLGILDQNGLPLRFLAVLVGIITFVAAIAQVLGRTLRDPWEHS